LGTPAEFLLYILIYCFSNLGLSTSIKNYVMNQAILDHGFSH
jgi:hypothetical protein